jgi:phosphatidylcholine synthase
MPTHPRFAVLRAWSVHFYTSLGLVCALISLIFLIQGNLKFALLPNAIAMFIDGTDGTLARRWKVKVYTPNFDGRKLDDITDYLNYAFIPVLFAWRFNLVPAWSLPILGFVLIAAAYGFCRSSAKTEDGYFSGFPNYWNVLVFYLMLFNLPAWVNASVLLIFAFLIWMPLEFASSQTVPLKRLTLAVEILFGMVALVIAYFFVNDRLAEFRWLVWVSLFGPVYYVAAGIYFKTLKRRAQATGNPS